jgi:hypothetical protein
MHNLRAERFYKPMMANGLMASADGPIKTFQGSSVSNSQDNEEGKQDETA